MHAYTDILSRLFSTSFIQIFRSIIVFFISVILARKLGSEAFGNYAFLTAAFIQVWSLIDGGFQNSFYTNLSSKNQGKNFYTYSLALILLQLMISSLLILLFLSTNFLDFFFLTKNRELIFWAFLSIISQKSFLNNATLIAESMRKNFYGNIFELIAVSFQILSIVILFSMNISDLDRIFMFITFANLASCALSILIIKREYLDLNISFREYFDSTIIYMRPLLLFSWISFSVQFFDIWILSKIGGFTEQSYFQVAHRFSLIFIVFLVALNNINWKETAELNENKRISELYDYVFNIMRYVCCAAIIFSLFLFANSENLLTVFFGKEYVTSASILTFELIMLNIIFHSVGVVSTSSFYGSKRASVIVFFQSFALITGLFLSIYLVADNSFFRFGLDLGSSGFSTMSINRPSLLNSATP